MFGRTLVVSLTVITVAPLAAVIVRVYGADISASFVGRPELFIANVAAFVPNERTRVPAIVVVPGSSSCATCGIKRLLDRFRVCGDVADPTN
jgi:hypothetical protein